MKPGARLARHLLAVIVFPVTMALLVPLWIASRWSVSVQAPSVLVGWLLLTAGVGSLLLGSALFLACLLRFAREGRGTLAPWDPPRQLVVRGPYRFVRNPMISGVILVLVGEALLTRSMPHAIWAAVFTGINMLYIPLFEEPRLEERFGEAYRRYKRRVPRFLPRPPSRDDAAGSRRS